MYYAGIGSRETPDWVIDIMEKMGKWLAKKGDILRSGGANGADSAFERGCDEANGKKEIFLPWKRFNGNNSSFYKYDKFGEAMEIAKSYHPYWKNLSDGGKSLQARNSFQVLGLDLETPSDFVVCYTEGGKEKGGTAQAIRIAKDKGIPIFNLGNYTYEQRYEMVDDFNKFYLEIKREKEEEKETNVER